MKISSIFYSITMIFIIALACIFVTFISVMQYDKAVKQAQIQARYSLISFSARLYLNGLSSQEEFVENLKSFNTKVIPQIEEMRNILSLGVTRGTIQLEDGFSTIYQYKGKTVLRVVDNGDEIFIQDDDSHSFLLYVVRIAFIFVAFLLMLFYGYVIKKIKPLRDLRSEINKFAKGDLDVKNLSRGYDEISIVSDAFYRAVSELRILQESRRLFLRNSLHELKTPLTKGRLIVEMMPNEKPRERLNSVFTKMETLIAQFALVEQVQSTYNKAEAQNFSVIHVVDNAIDKSMCEAERLKVDVVAAFEVACNFEMLSVAVKNLIDNGLKYSHDNFVELFVGSKFVSVSNLGDPLERELAYYEQPFIRGDNSKAGTSKNSFGLGLYIVSHICKAHGFKFSYEYVNGKSVFRIDFE